MKNEEQEKGGDGQMAGAVSEDLYRLLRGCPLLEGKGLFLDFLGDEGVSLSVSPVTVMESRFTDGGERRKIAFSLSARLPYGPEPGCNPENSGWMEAMANWLEGQAKGGSLMLGGGRVLGVEFAQGPYLSEEDGRRARYRLEGTLLCQVPGKGGGPGKTAVMFSTAAGEEVEFPGILAWEICRNPKVYTRQYMDEPGPCSALTGYAPEVRVTFCPDWGEPLHREVLELCRGGAVGPEAARVLRLVHPDGSAEQRRYTVMLEREEPGRCVVVFLPYGEKEA